jgi:DNA-binding transcriptional LysR family regulator
MLPFTLQQLRILKAVATENLTRAAELLYVSQPSLSKQIKTLEEESGYPFDIEKIIKYL